MRHKPLGLTGLFVSELRLGTMTFSGSSGIWSQIGSPQQADSARLVARRAECLARPHPGRRAC
jgi:aryl-alcohol dehydrogenase-like predicted oxidoreductase